MDIDSQAAQQLDELVGQLSELGWSVEDICARVRETYRQMEDTDEALEI
jgi:hypothetical protein